MNRILAFLLSINPEYRNKVSDRLRILKQEMNHKLNENELWEIIKTDIEEAARSGERTSDDKIVNPELNS